MQRRRPRRPGRGARRRLHAALLPGPARRRRPGRHPLREGHAGGRAVARRLHAGRRRPRSSAATRTSPSSRSSSPSSWRTAGSIDPERIESYIAADGYRALHAVLREMTPKERGRQRHQERAARARAARATRPASSGPPWPRRPAPRSTSSATADEGDPGAFMDRSVLESDPHSVLEGMAIAGLRRRREPGIHLRPRRVSARHQAAADRHQAGEAASASSGSGIFESPFNFTIDIRIGAGAYVCGEETALMASIEGKRGTPRPRPPFPAESGLWGCPTLINNVETFANIPPIIRKGAEWFASIGTEKSKGTKVFALAGKIAQHGPDRGADGHAAAPDRRGDGRRGARRRQDQGRADRRALRRLHPGAASSTRRSTTSRSRRLGSIMGSGGMIVMDESTRMPEIARFFMEFCMDESCGKCIPCRAGTVQMHHLLDKIVKREAHRAGPGEARGALRHGRAHEPVRPRPERAQPGAQHPALLPQRIPRAAAARGPNGTAAAAPDARTAEATDPMAAKTLIIDGKQVSAAGRRHHPGGGHRRRDQDPDPLPPGRRLRRRRLPAVPGRGRPASTSSCPPARPGSPRAWTSTPTPSACASTAG